MIRAVIASSLLLASVPATAASPIIFDFSGTGNTTAPSYSFTATGSQGALTLTASSLKFNLAPGGLTNLSQTTATGLVRQTVGGLGIVGGGDTLQIDTNNPGAAITPQREGLLLTGSTRFSIHSLKLSSVDQNDTLKVYGILPNGVFDDLGYGTSNETTAGGPGTIRGGLNGAATGLVFTAANGGTAAFNVVATPLYTSYLLTTRAGGDVNFGGDTGQGYRLQGLTTALPEPSTWAMLIAGFGLVGVTLRRRRAGIAA